MSASAKMNKQRKQTGILFEYFTVLNVKTTAHLKLGNVTMSFLENEDDWPGIIFDAENQKSTELKEITSHLNVQSCRGSSTRTRNYFVYRYFHLFTYYHSVSLKGIFQNVPLR